MNCAWYERWLTASADDELAGWRAALLRRHLAGCPRCTAEITQLRRVRELVASQKERYVAQLDDRLFWQQLRGRLQTPPTASAFQQEDEPQEPAGVAFFGMFPASRLAWSAVAVALFAATLLGLHLVRAPQGDQLALDIPLLPPPGQGRVHFTEVKSTKGLWAGVMKFDESDAAIPVIWVDGMPYMGKELKHPSNEL